MDQDQAVVTDEPKPRSKRWLSWEWWIFFLLRHHYQRTPSSSRSVLKHLEALCSQCHNSQDYVEGPICCVVGGATDWFVVVDFPKVSYMVPLEDRVNMQWEHEVDWPVASYKDFEKSNSSTKVSYDLAGKDAMADRYSLLLATSTRHGKSTFISPMSRSTRPWSWMEYQCPLQWQLMRRVSVDGKNLELNAPCHWIVYLDTLLHTFGLAVVGLWTVEAGIKLNGIPITYNSKNNQPVPDHLSDLIVWLVVWLVWCQLFCCVWWWNIATLVVKTYRVHRWLKNKAIKMIKFGEF